MFLHKRIFISMTSLKPNLRMKGRHTGLPYSPTWVLWITTFFIDPAGAVRKFFHPQGRTASF